MEHPGTQPQQTKIPINKKQLFADLVAFGSIVSSYFLISLTLHFNIFENQLGLILNSYTTIIVLYLSYTAFIIVFKLLAIVLSLLNKTQGENSLAGWINSELNYSLLMILAVSSFYNFVHIAFKPFSIQQFCHIALWLWLAEVLRILGSLFGRLTGITSLDYLGKSIGVILLLGGVLQPLGFGVFATF